MKLRCPIHKNYIHKRKTSFITQWFGNVHPKFGKHYGVDFRIKGPYKWLYHRFKGYSRVDRTAPEEVGLIPILAAHDGYLTSSYNDDKKEGIYVKIKDGDYETLYFHLDKIRVWKGDKNTAWDKMKGKDFVKKGSIIGWGGNTGKYTTGSHLHFELRHKGKRIDPIPYFQDNVVYRKGSTKYFKGKNV